MIPTLATPTNAFIEFKKSDVERSVPERFQQQVARYPDRMAIKTRRHEFTYRTLDETANRVARAILAEGEGEVAQIALLLENDAPIVAALLGVLKAGKIYVPLDPT
ncbi:MAG: AMP-binding protein, partial [Candidatus Rokubacteria bacterium]|nr:AMP-binding protein [Candidatus Rokubacteria bacterium]